MKKTKMLLSLVMMLALSVSVFAKGTPEDKTDCFIPPCPQDEEICCNDTINECDMNVEHNDFHYFKHHKKDFKDFRKGNHFGKCDFKKLNLTDKQKEDLKALKQANMKKQQELMKTIIDEKKAINEELLKEKYSEKAIKKSIKKIKETSAKMIDNKIAEKQAMKKILTNEQYVKMFKHPTKIDILAEKLNLSKEQQEKVKKIFDTNKEKKMELVKQLKEKQDLLKQELSKTDFSKDTAISLNNDINELSKKMFSLKIEKREQMKSVLSEEQYNKMVEMHHKRMPANKNIDKK